jgi:hypothetical protein
MDFVRVYRLYRRVHTARYALRSAWRITVQGVPF